MLMVAATPFGGLLGLFVAVPLGIVCGIYGSECAATLRARRRRRRSSHPGGGQS